MNSYSIISFFHTKFEISPFTWILIPADWLYTWPGLTMSSREIFQREKVWNQKQEAQKSKAALKTGFQLKYWLYLCPTRCLLYMGGWALSHLAFSVTGRHGNASESPWYWWEGFSKPYLSKATGLVRELIFEHGTANPSFSKLQNVITL